MTKTMKKLSEKIDEEREWEAEWRAASDAFDFPRMRELAPWGTSIRAEIERLNRAVFG